jgi:hypothetical protein
MHKFKEIVLDVITGEITQTIREAIEVSGTYGWTDFDYKGALVKFDFNGVMVSVQTDSDPELIHRDWLRALNGYIDKAVGPYPNPVLTDEEKESDARIEAKNETRRQEWRDEANARHAEAVKTLEETLKDAPAIELSDESAWQESVRINSGSPYGNGVVVFAERWARIMQVKLEAGEKLEDIADASTREADVDGITGFMYGCAVSLLAQTWKHGRELNRWHNKQYGVDEDAEGTVNPAVLTLSMTSD